MDRFGGDRQGNGQADDDFDDLDDDMFGDDVFDEGDDDVFGGGDEGSSVDEIEHRVDEMESEVGRISSTVGTIRSENEEIRESVEETEENVRKLLEVYEMVTRGVNPFVDDGDDAFGGAANGRGGGFGLFDDEGDENGIDDELAGADAESFFDEDFEDDEDESEGDLTASALVSDETVGEGADGGFGGADDAVDDGGLDPDPNPDTDTERSGTGFDDLKAEYESDDADWDGDNEDEAIDTTAENDALGVVGEQDDDGPGRPAAERNSGLHGKRASGERAKPYLDDISGGYTADPIVLEWLGYLVENADGDDAMRAIGYYETIEWISADVAERLRAFLAGFAGVESETVTEGGPKALGIDHHMRSLAYVSLLASNGAEAELIDRWSVMTDRKASRTDQHETERDGL